MKTRLSFLLPAVCIALAVAMSAPTVFAQAKPGFNDHDRQAAHDWYNANKAHPPVGLRDQDRLPDNLQSRLVAGAVVGSDFHHYMHSVPKALQAEIAPPPHGCHYELIGHQVVMLDAHNTVVDTIALD